MKFFTKVIIVLAFLGLSFKKVNAQYVTIPDSSFVTWLQTMYPTCMNGNQMDTTCTPIVNATSVNVTFILPLFQNLEGIQYFDNLSSLTIGMMDIHTLPRLPKSLLYLDCNSNQIDSLPALPDSLIKLVCWGNQLHNLPLLPPHLEELGCSGNFLSNLVLPNSLKKLNCSLNPITSLPVLPPNLIELMCGDNQLTNLPNLPNTISTLICSNNQLSLLPTLPNSLNQLACSYNLLTSLPDLPTTLLNLNCHDNNIICLPQLPTSITQYCNVSNNLFSCLPNYVAAMDSATLTIPLCQLNDTLNNPNSCPEAIGILGTIYKDNNANCVMNNTDNRIRNVKVKFFNPVTNQFGSTYSALNGVFDYPANPGTHLALVDTLNKPYQANCAYPGIDSTVITTILSPLATDVNFDIKCAAGLDLNVQSIARRNGYIFPGEQHTLQIITGDASQWYGLNCSDSTSGQVQVTVTGPVTYNGVAAGALIPTITGNIYTYNIADFGTINNSTSFQLLLKIDTTAQAGDIICANAVITPFVGDINPIDNSLNFCYPVTNSLDPNYKEVYPKDVQPGFQDWLTYTIHFQNTGNAPAINIRLLDTLDTNLDVETFEVINYSHYNTVTLMDGIVDFRFPNILLPDSTSDLAGSQGFVQYRIKPKANLPAGTQIANKANIYFDFNAPVETNTTVNNFTTAVGVSGSSHMERKEVWVYPNPSTGIFNLSSTASIEVYNLVGELVISQSNTAIIDLSHETKGIYFVKVNGSITKKLIKN